MALEGSVELPESSESSGCLAVATRTSSGTGLKAIPAASMASLTAKFVAAINISGDKSRRKTTPTRGKGLARRDARLQAPRSRWWKRSSD